jgi:Sec-independent protein secretion pathway component TatC
MDGMDTRQKLSVLWIVVMMNMIFADILSFMLPGTLQDIISGNMPMKITQSLLLVFALLLEVPIIMILLSRVLNRRINRMANITASVITIFFVVAGGSGSLHYIFFASVEVIVMLYIAWTAFGWREHVRGAASELEEVRRVSAGW